MYTKHYRQSSFNLKPQCFRTKKKNNNSKNILLSYSTTYTQKSVFSKPRSAQKQKQFYTFTLYSYGSYITYSMYTEHIKPYTILLFLTILFYNQLLLLFYNLTCVSTKETRRCTHTHYIHTTKFTRCKYRNYYFGLLIVFSLFVLPNTAVQNNDVVPKRVHFVF